MIGAVINILRAGGMVWANPLLLIVPIVGLSGTIGWHIMHERSERAAEVQAAYADGKLAERKAWEQAMTAESARQKEVGHKALAEAKAEINRLQQENLSLVAAGQEWDREAEREANAGEWCLSPDSLLRLNKAR